MTIDRQHSLRRRGALTVELVCLGFVIGCTTTSQVSPSIGTHFIQLREQVIPQDLYVYVGDEVRWQNPRPDPLKVGILSHHRLDLVSCEKGFTHFATMEDIAMIRPREYVSVGSPNQEPSSTTSG